MQKSSFNDLKKNKKNLYTNENVPYNTVNSVGISLPILVVYTLIKFKPIRALDR